MNSENLLQKVEEKVLAVLAEMENMRKELMQLRSENARLRNEQGNYTQKLQELVSLLDVLESSEGQVVQEEPMFA